MAKNLIRAFSYIVFLLLVCNFLYGCAPTYPKEKLAESLIGVCKKEYNLDVQADVLDQTIVVFIPLDELFNAKLDIIPEAIEKIESVVLVTSRIIFSTDAEIDFYMIIAADTKTTAAELILIRCMDDVFKFMNGWIRREEYRRRVLWEINFDPRHLKKTSFDFNNVERLTLPVFIVKQVAQRLNFTFESSEKYKAKVKGVYKEQDKQFYFSLIVADENKFKNIYTPIILHKIASVLQNYKFHDFNQVMVENLLSKKTIIVNKEELKHYLKMDQIEIEQANE